MFNEFICVSLIIRLIMRVCGIEDFFYIFLDLTAILQIYAIFNNKHKISFIRKYLFI